MFVCQCFAVTESQIKKMASESKDSSLNEIQKKCGAGKDCGSCLFQIQELLQTKDNEEQNEENEQT